MDATDPRAVRTRRAVLDATVELLARRGVEATTMDAVARATGISRSTLYRHWPERMPLLADAIDHVAERFVRERSAETPGGELDVELEASLQRVVGGLGAGLRSPEWGPIAGGLAGAAEHDPALAAIFRRYVSARRQVLVDVLVEARERGEIPGGLDLAWLAALFAGPLYYHRLVLHEPWDADDVAAHVHRTLALVRDGA